MYDTIQFVQTTTIRIGVAFMSNWNRANYAFYTPFKMYSPVVHNACWNAAKAGNLSRPFTNRFKRFQGNPVSMASYSPPVTNAHWRTHIHTHTRTHTHTGAHLFACGLAVFIVYAFCVYRWRREFCTIGGVAWQSEWFDVCVYVLCCNRSHIRCWKRHQRQSSERLDII